MSTPPLIVLGIGGAPLLLSGALFGIFLAIGRVDLQIKLMITGAIIKLIGNITLIRIPHINITGAAISTVACYSVISIIGLIMLKGIIKQDTGLTRYIVQPFIFAALCGITAYTCYNYVFTDYNSFMRLATSIAGGALVYLITTLIADRRHISRHLPHLLSTHRRRNAQIPHH